VKNKRGAVPYFWDSPYGDKYGIEFRSNIGKGTLITVRIRALTLKQLEERLK